MGKFGMVWAVLLLMVVLLAGCASEPAEVTERNPPVFLGDWQLVNIQSMDDRVYVPAEGTGFTLSLNPDGSVELTADCNTGRGSWESSSSARIQFSPLATTRALCPPGSLHDRYLSDLSWVRSYVMQGNDLFLATYADGAILHFRPAINPSFDCSRAAGAAEQLVCRDSDLASLDLRLEEVFSRAVAGTSGDDQRLLQAFQRGWIKGRNDCWKAPDLRACVEGEYRQRIAELEVQSGAVEVPDASIFNCDDGSQLTAYFYRNTQLPLVVLNRPWQGSLEQVFAYQAPSGSGTRYLGRNVSLERLEPREKAGDVLLEWGDLRLGCKLMAQTPGSGL